MNIGRDHVAALHLIQSSKLSIVEVIHHCKVHCWRLRMEYRMFIHIDVNLRSRTHSSLPRREALIRAPGIHNFAYASVL